MTEAPNRYEQRKAATHRQLLDATRALLAEKGYIRTDVTDIVDRADVSRGTFYKHFTDKADAVRELIQQGFDELINEIIGGPRATELDPAQAQQKIRRVFQWAQDNRELTLVMVGGIVSPSLNAFGRNYMVDVTEHALMTILENRPPEQERRLPTVVLAQMISGLFIQLVNWWLSHDSGYSVDDIATMTYEMIAHGARPFKEEPE